MKQILETFTWSCKVFLCTGIFIDFDGTKNVGFVLWRRALKVNPALYNRQQAVLR